MKALVLKCHHESTVSRAYLVQRMVPGIRVFGGVVLNSYVGGINPAAVEAALRLGGKEVWMPTVDAGYHAQVHGGTGGYDAQQGGRRQTEGIWVTDADGRLKPPVKDVLALVAEHQAILGTCHLSPAEIVALVREARRRRREDRRHPPVLQGAQPRPRHRRGGRPPRRHARVRLLHLARLAVRRPREDRRGGRAGRRLALPAGVRHGTAAQPDAVGGPARLRPDHLREGRERAGRPHHDRPQPHDLLDLDSADAPPRPVEHVDPCLEPAASPGRTHNN